MSKKKNKSLLGKVIYALAIVAGIAAICMMFVTSLRIEGNLSFLRSTSEFTGAQTTFGYATENATYFQFSFMNLLPYVLVLVAVVLTALKLFGVLKSNLFDFLSLAMFVVAGVFFFLTVNFAVMSEGLSNAINVANRLTTVVTTHLGVGAIVAGVLSLVSAFMLLIKAFVAKK